ncbi:hypothetical protein EVAR_33760_1 [Eumeta japonica]|uniref:Uncharacterized protein n=1 Tax=Eumeta variegata TaxID=151549 RepID=A0A4C1VS36_EUMVA|nr:hypothetical protein EVAR_33760_1 [Eumeta japonica]
MYLVRLSDIRQTSHICSSGWVLTALLSMTLICSPPFKPVRRAQFLNKLLDASRFAISKRIKAISSSLRLAEETVTAPIGFRLGLLKRVKDRDRVIDRPAESKRLRIYDALPSR